MAKIIAFANQKGGVGKTTSAVNVAASLGLLDKKTLLVDLDPQGNATSGVGIAKKSLKGTIKDVLTGETEIKNVVLPTNYKNLWIIPTNVSLSGAEFDLYNDEGSEYNLKDAFETISNEYDYIIIDCSPSLGLITINSLTAADSLIIPVQCEFFALEGLGKLLNTTKIVQNRLNPSLEIEGFLLTMFDARLKSANQVVEDVRHHFGNMVFKTVIARNVRLSEAPSHGKPVILYDALSSGSNNYLGLAKEIITKDLEQQQN